MTSVIQLHQFETDEAEAAGIARAISEHSGGIGCGAYAVLARTRRVANMIADRLEESGLPVRRRRKAEAEPREWARARAAVRALQLRTRGAIVRWLRTCLPEREVAELLAKDDAGACDLVDIYLGAAPDSEEELWLNLKLLDVDEASIERTGELWATLVEKSLANLSLAMAQTKVEEETLGEGIFCGTIHAAKGQEWPYVVLAGFEEGIIPKGESDVEEDRRVAFVGMTRAMKGLWITCAKRRGAQWGSTLLLRMEPSRFIAEAGLEISALQAEQEAQ